ncbi:sulfotransferase 1E1-like [Glandiceps talaboti]
MATEWPGFFYDGSYFLDSLHDVNAIRERRIDDWDIREDDVVIVTFPKSGTLWMHNALRMMYRDLNWQLAKTQKVVRLCQLYEPSDDRQDIYSMHKRATQTTLNRMSSPRLMISHLHPQFFHSDWRNGKKKCKVICVTRNPKDVCVSFYHFAKSLPFFDMNLCWEDWVQAFSDGRVWCGPWLDFTLAWKDYGLEDNVLHVTFEDMKKDLKSVLSQVGDFLGRPKSDEELDRVTTSCGFDAMKRSCGDNQSIMAARDNNNAWRPGQCQYFRKGKVGDWKNHFTIAQNVYFDQKITTNAERQGLELVYEL